MRLSIPTVALGGLLAFALLLLAAPDAEAHSKKRHFRAPGWHHGHAPGHWHGRGHFRGHRHRGVGAGIVFHSAPRRLYIERPPRVIYVDPDPVIVESPGYRRPPAPRYAEPERYCREVTKTVVIDGKLQNAWGRACYQPDGSWQWVDD